MKQWIVAGLVLGLVAGCSGENMDPRGRAAMSEAASAPMATMDAEVATEPAGAGATPTDPGNPSAGDTSLGAMLAYEHGAEVRIAPARIPERLQAVREACEQARFGACVVLSVEQQGGDWPSASLSMRMVPEAIEPTLALAGEGADIGSRSTRAEDLAVAVRDNTLLRERLTREREQLLAFQQRRDLAVADMIALSRQLAEVEAQLQMADQQAAQHQRRIRTQLLTLRLLPTASQQGRNEIGQALREVGATLAAGTAWTIRAAAFLLPLALLVGVVLWWRRRRRRRLA